jgi:serine/threonine-protein kinase PRP4
VRHKHSGHSRHDAEDDLELRSPTSVNGHDPNSGDVKETRGNVERTRIDNDDKGDVVVWEVEQEDEELNLIEESRRRTQAIMEKYKKKLEQQNGFSSHDLELANIPKQSSTVADVLGSGTLGPVTSAVNQAKAGLDIDAVDGEVAKLSSAVGESPAQLVISDSDRTLASTGLGEGSPKDKISDDMFTDDIFGESPADSQKMGYLRGKGNGIPIVRSGLDDNWDDAEGYYSYQLGELLDDRYEIMATHGKGVFSTVVRAKDTKAELGEPEEVAIKIIRNNETMHKAGQTEIQILKKLAGSDPENKRHCVRFLSTFKYRNHLCLVFESLHLNLREIVKKYGRNIGIQLSGVRVYATQLFISLKHLKNCGVLHCDIKPDNMLVNEGRNTLKLCDFGSAMFAGTNEVTPYLVSRFYRAPEIILGLPYDHPLDIWSVGCCLYELFSGKIMFPGSTNNEMLRLHMELKGAFPKKMLRKGAFIDQHFDKDLCFYATEEDSVTRKTTKRMMVNIKPKEFGSVIKQRYKDEDSKLLVHFRDLLDRIFILDPQKRITVSQALAHPFITGK